MKIACIGVGNMGGSVARRIATGGFTVTVYDPDPQAMARCAAAGATEAHTLDGAVADADVVLTSLPTTALVTSTVEELATRLPSGTAVVDISTIDPQTARRAADTCTGHGLDFVACALGKTPSHAEKGQIPLFVGGDERVVSRLTPLFERMGERVHRFADVEGATTFKLVSNFIGMTNVAVLAEGVALARRAGIDPDLFSEALADTGAVSFQVDVRLPWMLARDWQARFGVDLAAKDVGLAVDAARAWGLDTPVGGAALAQLQTASQHGFGHEDVVALAKLHEQDALTEAATS